MKLDPVRKARQDQIINRWIANGYVGTAECATGFGKTIMAMLAIIKVREADPSLTVMVVVPTVFLQNQWVERLASFDIDNVEVWVINTAVKQTHFVDLLVLDEIHQYTAEIFGQIFDRVSYAQVFGLTATLREHDSRTDLIYDKAPIVDTVTMKEALDAGWIAPFEVFNLAIQLSDEEQEKYSALSKSFNKHFASFGHDFSLAMSCVSNQQTLKQYAKQLNWEEKRLQAAAFQWLNNMRERKDMLYSNPSKAKAAVELVHQFPDRKIITFSQTIESAEWISSQLGAESALYHSKVKGAKIDGKRFTAAQMKQKAVDRFNSGHHFSKCRVLCTAKAMDQGADIPDVDMAIIVSASATPLQAIQRYGRSLRMVEGKRTVIVELYIKGTQDERWLRSRQKKLPKGVTRWVSELSEIS